MLDTPRIYAQKRSLNSMAEQMRGRKVFFLTVQMNHVADVAEDNYQ
jgi:hypothetical protein